MYPPGSTLTDVAKFCEWEGMSRDAADDALRVLRAVHAAVTDMGLTADEQLDQVRGEVGRWADREAARESVSA